MAMRTCQTCGGITPSPWIPDCGRAPCRAARHAQIDAIVAESVRELQARLREEIQEAGLAGDAPR